MGEREKIVFADNMHNFFETVIERLTQDGHEFVAICKNVEELQEAIKHLNEESITPTVGIIDSRMPLRGDGEKASTLLRKTYPAIKIVSFSSSRQTYGDDHIDKAESLSSISYVIKNI